jgi:uncharacterized protein
MKNKQPDFLQKPMHEMTTAEWESLCDGCGLCCQIRVEDEDTSEIALSSDYANRQKNVPDCVKVTPENVMELTWLPHTCGYRLAAHGQPLANWHPLICGNTKNVHKYGPSMKGSIISEDEADWE